MVEAGDDAQQRGFSAARGAEQGQELRGPTSSDTSLSTRVWPNDLLTPRTETPDWKALAGEITPGR